MKADLPSYQEFRETGIPWIGIIPSHWEIRQLGFISNRVLVGVVINPSSFVSDEGVPFLLGGDIREFKIDTGNCNYCPPEISDGVLRKSRLTAGDLVVVRVGYPGVAAVVPPELEGANCASMMLIRKHRRFCSQWLAYVFNSQIGRDQIGIVQYGAAQKQFNISHAVKFQLPFPPLNEQFAIAAFLERETVKIDRLAEVRRKQIECLQEQRTAVIHHAVTKGLDPAAKMKPSGVEWLGDMPETWEVYQLRHLLRPGKDGIRIGPFGSSLKAEFIRDEGYKVYGQENVIGRDFGLGQRFIDENKYDELKEYTIREGDLLITMMGSIGRCIVVPSEIAKGIMDSHLIRLGIDTRKAIPRYIALLIEMAPYVSANIEWESKGSIMDGLNSAIIKRLFVALPRLPEQDSIMEYLAQETDQFDTLISKYQRELELLAEYRASLIFHAVTGKIDVRGVVENPST